MKDNESTYVRGSHRLTREATIMFPENETLRMNINVGCKKHVNNNNQIEFVQSTANTAQQIKESDYENVDAAFPFPFSRCSILTRANQQGEVSRSEFKFLKQMTWTFLLAQREISALVIRIEQDLRLQELFTN